MKCLTNKSLFFGFVIFTLTCSISCHDDDASDKCKEVISTDADFTIEVGIGWNEDRRYIETDTFATSRFIRFKSLHSLDSVHWKVGLDPRTFTGDSIEMFFEFAGSVTVTAIGFKKPDSVCFPEDTGVDTVKKVFHVVPILESAIFGDYEGYVESKPDSVFTLSIELSSDNAFAFVQNMPNGCIRGETDLTLWIGYREFFMPDIDQSGVCPKPKGWGILQKNHKDLTIDYSIWSPDSLKFITEKFIGIKK